MLTMTGSRSNGKRKTREEREPRAGHRRTTRQERCGPVDVGSRIIEGLLAESGRRREDVARWGAGMVLDVVEIQKLLPHRYPFLMVDAIFEMEQLKYASWL